MIYPRIHEMSLTQFASAMVPSWVMSCTNPLDVQPNQAQWLTSLWNSADKRLTVTISWLDTPLKDELPPDALRYRFDDLSLHASVLALGLDVGDQTDLRKVAELLATHNAWLSAIQSHCRQSAEVFANNVAQDFVRLSSDWLQHPWVLDSVRRYKEEQAKKKVLLANSAPREMSSDPLWPNSEIVHGRCDPLSPEEEVQRQKELRSIGYWIKKFELDNQCWSSEFDMCAWDAQCDIDVAQRKITGLQLIIEQQNALIRSFQRVIKMNKRREAELTRTDKSGRRPKVNERQEVALQFTSKWVQSLMDAFQVKNCAQLEGTIEGSSQRNWNRWLSGQAVPTSKSFTALQASKIARGHYEGQPLQAVETIPSSDDMLKLIRLTGVAPKASVLA